MKGPRATRSDPARQSFFGHAVERIVGQVVAIALALLTSSGGIAADSELPEELASAARELAANAEAQGLPGDRLIVKAREGAAKKVPVPRILAVLRRLRVQMGRVAALLDSAAAKPVPAVERRGLVGAAVAATEAGVPLAAIAKLAELGLAKRDNPGALQGALGALTNMRLQHYDANASLRLVEVALANGFEERDFPGLVRALRELGADADPQQAFATLHGLVARGERPEWLRQPPVAPSAAPPPWVGVQPSTPGQPPAEHPNPPVSLP